MDERRSRKDAIADRFQSGIARCGKIFEGLDIGPEGRPAIQDLNAFDRNHPSEEEMVGVLQRAVPRFLIETPSEGKLIKSCKILAAVAGSVVSPLFLIHASPATMTGIPMLVSSTPVLVP